MTDDKMTKVGTIKVRGSEFPVYVSMYARVGSEPSASFRSEYDGKTYSADTIESLYRQMMKATKTDAVRVRVPLDHLFVRRAPLSDRGKRFDIDTVYVTGLHAGTGNVLVERDGKSEQLDRYSGRFGEFGYYRPMPDEVRAELLRLKEEEDHIDKAINDLNERWGVRPEDVAKEAVDAVLNRGADAVED